MSDPIMKPLESTDLPVTRDADQLSLDPYEQPFTFPPATGYQQSVRAGTPAKQFPAKRDET